jgi:hypothetical protein
MTRIDYFCSALLSLPLLASVACTAEIPPGGTGGTGGSGPSPTGGSGGSAGTVIGTESCDDDGLGVAIPKRLVRLSYSQLANGVSAVLGTEARTAVDATGVPPKAQDREFQPLFSEGPQISTAVLPKTMQLAKAAADTVTAAPGCTAGDEACAQQFLLTLAQKVYRRPLTAEEQKSIQDFYAELKSHGDTVEQAVSYGVKGILLAAPALYRTEFGPAAGGRLEAAEIASQLSYFLTDGPPDADLLAAAAGGGLATEAGVREQVERLLATQAVRDNLKQVMLAYFQVGNVFADVKDPMLYPEYTGGLRASMYTENERFIGDVLWNGKVGDLLTSRKAFVNKVIAPIYGVTYPGPATDLEDVFLPVELPQEQRAGLITRGAMLAMRSRPDDTSVVSRGLFVNATMLCAQQPPEPPSSVLAQVGQQLNDKTATQRQKAEFRGMTSPCNGCHAFFDPYGLVLENYDAIGRYRTNYTNFPGSPVIDTTATLPQAAGGMPIKNVLELVQAVTENGRFSHCVTANLMRYVLADASILPSEDCAIQKANTAFRATDQTFSSLIKEIAVAQTVSMRVAQ